MTEPTESERREMNRRLARAMGIADDRWTFQCLKEDHLLDGHGPHAFCLTCVAPVSKSALVPPDFTRDHAASRELVEWVAGQLRSVYYNFIYHLFQQGLGWSKERLLEETDFEEVIITALTAPPLLIAIAADAATKGEG